MGYDPFLALVTQVNPDKGKGGVAKGGRSLAHLHFLASLSFSGQAFAIGVQGTQRTKHGWAHLR